MLSLQPPGEAVLEVIPDMSVMVSEVGQGAVIPSWVTAFGAGDILIDEDTVEWIKVSTTSFLCCVHAHYNSSSCAVFPALS